MSAAESDVELQNNSTEGKNEAKNLESRKITTKDMVHRALTELKSRKGTSLYAIKKFIEETYKVDVEKLNYIIKKSIKSSVEAGTIVQTKGIGASGSFKLAPGKQKAEKKKKPKAKKSVEKPTTAATSDKKEKSKKEKSTEKSDSQKPKKKVEIANPEVSKDKKVKSKKDSGKTITKKDAKVKSTKTSKMAEAVNRTPAKKKSAMMKRKSIGSIIKPPKMNPKNK